MRLGKGAGNDYGSRKQRCHRRPLTPSAEDLSGLRTLASSRSAFGTPKLRATTDDTAGLIHPRALYQPHLPRGSWAEQKAAVAPPAQAGEIMVIYRSLCPAEAQPAALENIEKMVAYERINIPLANSYSPGIRADGHVGAVDLHRSQEAPEGAFRWRSEDETWSAGYDAVAESCGLRVEDFDMYILTAH